MKCISFGSLTNTGWFVTVVLTVMSCLYLLAKVVLVPLSPFITLVVVVALTVNTFHKWATAMLAVAGIILYILSWFVLCQFGAIQSELVWSVGIMVWFTAVYRSFFRVKKE